MNPRALPQISQSPRRAGSPHLARLDTRADNGLAQTAWVLLVGAVVLYVGLSAPALFVLGVPYDSPAGAFPAKIHPGSYLLVLSWWVGLASHGNPLATLARQVRQQRLISSYLACMVLVFAWAVARHGPSGLAFIIDTLWMPGVALLSALLQPVRRQRQLFVWIMALMLLNAGMALVEFGLAQRLVPLHAGRADVVEEDFFRASALLGHPLANALITLLVVPAVLLLPWALHWRLLAGVLLALGLLTFGSRASFAGLGLYLLCAAWPLLQRAVRGGFSYLQLTGGLLGLVFSTALLAAVVAATGLGERIFKNLVWDNSAQVRLRAWDVLDHVSATDLWLGIPITRIDSIALRIGLDPRYEAIENFWLYLLLLLGVVGMVLFVLGLGCLLWRLWQWAALPLRVTMLVWLVMASGANTLASKSISLLLLALVTLGSAAVQPMLTRAAR